MPKHFCLSAAAASLAAALLLTMAAPAALAAPTPGADRVADADTRNDYLVSLGDDDSTLLDGRIWTDKSVDTGNIEFVGDAGTVTVENDSDFLVTYSALATSTQIISETTAPVDVVFVLDFSASMAWGQYENGRGTVTTQAESRVQAMVDGINDAIAALVDANDQNRIGIVVFNRGAQTMLSLGTVTPRPAGDYLAISYWNATPGQDDGNNGNVQVTCNIDQTTIPLDSYTNIHAGIYQGMQMLLNATDTDVEIDDLTFTRVPNLIVMSDGAPTTFSRASSGGDWWLGIENTPIGTGDNNNPHSGNGFLPLVTAAYFKNAVTAHYYPNAQPGQSARVFTIGFMTNQQNAGMTAMADLVLNPAAHWSSAGVYTPAGVAQVDAVNTAWQQYRLDTAPQVQYTTSGGPQNYTVDVAPEPNDPASLNYSDGYFAAADADALWDAFSRIIDSITSTAKGPTEVEGGDPVHSGYILYNDAIGQYMQVDTIKTILWAGISFELEDGFVPVAEPQPGGGVRYTYTGHFETADGGKTFDSPVYGRGNIDDILVTVNQDAGGMQTLRVAVPASAIPIRVNSITLDEDGTPIDNVSNNAYPLRLCYTVGLKDGVLNPDGTLNTNTASGGVSGEYLAAHTDAATHQVYFYSNLYTGNALDGETVGNATVEFNPASTNPFYYIQEDTPLYTDPDCTVRADAASFDPNLYYYFQDTYYAGTGSSVTARTYVIRRLGANLQNSVARDGSGWYIRADAPRIGNLADLVRPKGEGNLTDTADTTCYPTYQSGSLPDSWVLAYQGNNGRLALAAPASLTIAKTVTADAGLTVPAGQSFAFTLTVPGKAGQTLTVTRRQNGTSSQEQLALDGSGSAGFTLQAGESLTVPDMQNGGFTVVEDPAALPDGFVLESAAADPADIGSFDAGTGTYTGTVGADAALLTFTNSYRAQFPAGAGTVRVPVTKELTGFRTDWQEGESYTFAIAPADRADNNPNAAIPLTADTLTLSGAVPTGDFVLDFTRLLDADTLAVLRARMAEASIPATAESVATGETAAAQTPAPATGESARGAGNGGASDPEGEEAAPSPRPAQTPAASPPPAPGTGAGDAAPQEGGATAETARRGAPRPRQPLLTAAQAAELTPDQARAVVGSLTGTYYYTITESGSAADMAGRGVTKDQSRYEVAVTVTDNGAGQLQAALDSITRIAGPDGAALPAPEPAAAADFVNTTTPPAATPSPAPGTTATPAPTTGTPSAPQQAIPQTGDALPVGWLAAAAAVAAVGLGGAVWLRRRRR